MERVALFGFGEIYRVETDYLLASPACDLQFV